MGISGGMITWNIIIVGIVSIKDTDNVIETHIWIGCLSRGVARKVRFPIDRKRVVV